MVRYDDRKNVHTALYQFHAPKLDELGLIEYGKRSGTVGLTPAGSDLRVSVGTDGDGEDAQFMPLWGAFGVSIVVLATGVSVSHVGAVVSMTAALAMGAGYLITANHSDDEERWQGVVVEHPPPPVSED
jgi:hypothetical protein